MIKIKICIVAFLLLILTGCGTPPEHTLNFFAMDTLMRVTVYGQNAQATAEQIEARVNELSQLLSRTDENSEIYKINHGEASSGKADTYIASAYQLSQATQGNFDPTIAPLSDLWRIGTEAARVPEPEEITQALVHVGIDKVHLTKEDELASIDAETELDLGGIGKGIAADEAAQIAYENEADALIVLGGNIYAVGTNNGKLWSVGIANPDDSTQAIVKLEMRDLSAVTTGDYERFLEQNGIRYHHVFDPQTGYPAKSDLHSVTVLNQNSTMCDAYSTALFVMGLEKAQQFCADNDIAAIFVTQDKQVLRTKQVDTLCTYTFIGAEKGYTDAGYTITAS